MRLAPPLLLAHRTGLLCALALLAGCFDFSSLNAKSKDAGDDGALDAPKDAPKDAVADARDIPDACSDEFVNDAGMPLKRVFLTSKKYHGALGGLTGADEECQDLAEAAGQCGEWKAFLSDLGTRAHVHAINVPEAEYIRMDNVTVAKSAQQFEDASDAMGPWLDAYIDVDESGNQVPGDAAAEIRVWTGTLPTGSEAEPLHCSNWSSDVNTHEGLIGYARNGAGGPNGNWLTQGLRFCNLTARLYCFEQ